MISLRIEFEYYTSEEDREKTYDSTEFDLENSPVNNELYYKYTPIIDLMNLWTEFVQENDFINPEITDIEEVPYDGEED